MWEESLPPLPITIYNRIRDSAVELQPLPIFINFSVLSVFNMGCDEKCVLPLEAL